MLSKFEPRFNQVLNHGQLEKTHHQMEGVRWCLENELSDIPFMQSKARGGFIADEMGLGKTITMIGTIFCNFKMPTLIVMPVVLLDQWYKEIFRTTGHQALIYHGKQKYLITPEKIMRSPIILTTYGMITINKKKFTFKSGATPITCILHEIKWGRVIFDEAHHLRNSSTGRFIGAKMLKTNIRWLVSGTPIQNNKRDFYTLCRLLKIPSSFYTEKENMSIISRHLILRRTKKDIGIHIPDIFPDISVVPWKSIVQQRFSAKIHSMLKFSGTNLAEGENLLRFKNYEIIQLLTRAKQSCILPSLVKSALLEGYIGEESCKLDLVIETILQKKDNGSGKLVFCNYRREIDILAQRLREGGIDNVATFDGRNSMSSRADLLSQKHNVLILQIQTGCEGLNLQQNYSEIYFVTPHWNPSVEDQAIGRCHRIGQTKPVKVFRFQMDGFQQEGQPGMSFDSYVSLIQDKKREIIKEFII